MSAPKGTPPEIVETLNKAINDVLKDPKLVARFAEIGGVPTPMSPEDYGKHIASETEKWRKVVEFAGVSVDGGLPSRSPNGQEDCNNKEAS
jgi:tripartite-type tricarboxylate transporter receptor subunit TctC